MAASGLSRPAASQPVLRKATPRLEAIEALPEGIPVAAQGASVRRGGLGVGHALCATATLTTSSALASSDSVGVHLAAPPRPLCAHIKYLRAQAFASWSMREHMPYIQDTSTSLAGPVITLARNSANARSALTASTIYQLSTHHGMVVAATIKAGDRGASFCFRLLALTAADTSRQTHVFTALRRTLPDTHAILPLIPTIEREQH